MLRDSRSNGCKVALANGMQSSATEIQPVQAGFAVVAAILIAGCSRSFLNAIALGPNERVDGRFIELCYRGD